MSPYEFWNLVFMGLIAIVTTIYSVFAGFQWRVLRDQTQSGSRAFVFLKEVKNMQVRDPNTQKITSLEFFPVWENSGNTPAKNMLMCVNYDYRDSPLPKEYTFADFSSNDESYPIDLGPHTETATIPYVMPISKIVAIQKREMRLYIHGWVKYQDVLKGTPWHTTNFCKEVIVRPDGNLMFIVYPKHNDSN